MNDMTTKPTAAQITALLQHRHAAPEWASFAQLPSNTGGINRYLDFYAINLWHSKRYLKVAYEIKISRSDFHREMNEPRKREFAEKIADEAYFATPLNLINPDEVPEGWGLIEMNAGGLRIKKRAPQRKVEDLPMSFIASLARRLSDPPQALPAALWLLAGQEVDRERLYAIANEDVRQQIQQAKQQALREYRQSADVQKTQRIIDLIQRHLGWAYTSDLDKLEQWLTASKDERPGVIPVEVQAEINRLEENIRLIKKQMAKY
jgi:hypothetical protein